MPVIDVYLASASPRRRELLQQIGVRFDVVKVDVPEIRQPGESPREFASRLARQKAETGWQALASGARRPVIGADTIVVVDDIIMGKPVNRDDGIAMLQRLAGRSHQVITAIAVCGEQCSVAVNESTVRFRALARQECEQYWQSGEPQDKAGGYAIQGLAAVFIVELHGSYSGVMGLPLYETAQLLSQYNIPVWCQDRP